MESYDLRYHDPMGSYTIGHHNPTFGYHDPMESYIRKEERHSAWTGLSTNPDFLPPHIPWDPTLYASSARRSLVYALNFRKKILYGIF